MFNDSIKKICFYVVDISLVILLSFFISWTFFSRFVMQGLSMSPYIYDRDIVVVNRLYKNLFKLQRYEVIVFNINGQDSIKRIIGLPGDNIKISSGNIYINGEKIPDDIIHNSLSSNIEQDVDIGEDEYYVLGDKLDSSKDSRFEDVGNIKKKQIIGRVWYIIKNK